MTGGRRPMWIILPIKNLDQAKQRLAGALTPGERRQLFETMLTDVFEAISGTRRIAGTLIVSREPRAEHFAATYGARIITEPLNEGQSAAVQRGVDWVIANGGRGAVTVPGDAPGVTAAEIDELVALNGADARALTLCPSHDRRGTNCIVATPADLITFHFGHDSFAPHLEEAAKAGVTPRIRPLPGLGLDLDTPEDVLKFLEFPATTRTHAFLAETGIAERLQAGRVQGLGA
ncbi:MAG: 2-phospho-L-lactate guanylyltransferase [Pseudomonadota bacterium]|nr:2-phospho-L-lactate guanylyltransferase [Pseudomonadota bacterium]